MSGFLSEMWYGSPEEEEPKDPRSDLHIYLERRELINAREPSKRKYEGGCWDRTGLPTGDTDNVSLPSLPTISIICCPYTHRHDGRCRAPRTIHGGSYCDGACKYNALHSTFEMPDGTSVVQVVAECIYRVVLTNGTEGCSCGTRTSIFCSEDCENFNTQSAVPPEPVRFTLIGGRVVDPSCRWYRETAPGFDSSHVCLHASCGAQCNADLCEYFMRE